MNIPYYYNSGYADDGVEIFTCLQCGDEIHVRSYYKPKFCPYCGVEYKGRKKNIGNTNKYWHAVCFVEEGYWAMEKRTTEVWGEPAIDDKWKEIGYYKLDNINFKQILKEKKRHQIEDENDRNQENEDYLKNQHKESPFLSYYEYRIIRKKRVERHSILVRKDRYIEKTGKEFNEHQDRIPYGAKQVITTGFKFLPK